MTLPATADIVIIGGGVMGASTLYHLAARGQKNLLLLEKEEFFGQGATGRCAGGVRYQFSTEVNVRLSQESLPMLERFKDEIGQEIDYRMCGYLIVCTNEADRAAFKRNLDLQRGLGVETEWLTGDQVRERLPSFRFEDAIGATFHRKDGLVDPNSVVAGYISAARALNKVEVTGLELKQGGITAVLTDQGRISTNLVVNAAGPWAGLVAEMAGVHIPLTSLRRQMFTTTPLPAIPDNLPFVIDFAQSLYFHREGQGLLIGIRAGQPGSGDRAPAPGRVGWHGLALGRAVRGHAGCTPVLREDGCGRLPGGRRFLRARFHARPGFRQAGERADPGWGVQDPGRFHARPGTFYGRPPDSRVQCCLRHLKECTLARWVTKSIRLLITDH